MGDRARQYKPSTIRRLDTLSGNQCSAPDCDSKLIARDKKTIVSKICHMEAASSEGPRYNSNMGDDERRHFDNLILLCDECHSIIDNKENESKYPVSLLQEWKRNHESTRIGELRSDHSLLKVVIDKIADKDFDSYTVNATRNIGAFSIDEKIKHNAIKRNKTLIEEYRIFYSRINTLYTEMEKQGSFKKERLLRNIRNTYLKVKGSYVLDSENPLQIIRDNADSIIEDVEDSLLKLIDSSENHNDDVSFGVSVIMVDAFMRCKIMEEIPKS